MVACQTVTILQLQEHHQKFPQDSRSKVFLKELIEKRRSILHKLRKQDYARYEYILEKLNLVHHPYLEENPRLFIKDCTRRLLKKRCDEVIKKKLEDYRKELESQQKTFFKEKADKLEFLRNEEIACGITPTISEEEIEVAKQKAASFS